MSPFKRHQRASSKQAAGRRRHARPESEKLREGTWPLKRTPFAKLVADVHMPFAEVPAELQSQDYDFPTVTLPASRPQVSAAELLDALADDDTQPLALDGLVVDETPQAAHHAGLAPAAAPWIPVPDNPFLNAHPPKHAKSDAEPTQVIVRVGNALPARLTAPELMLLGRPVPADAPSAPSLPPAPPPYQPARRDREHPLVFAAFDDRFWVERGEEMARLNQHAARLRRQVDQDMIALDASLRDLEAERAAWDAMAPWLYQGQLAQAAKPLPRRTPGASLAAIEASRGQLVTV